MKRLGNIWEEVIAFENLLFAYRKARRGKRSRREVLEFSLRLEQNLLQLRRELQDGSYRPGGYRLFTLYERKPRQIAAAPFRLGFRLAQSARTALRLGPESPRLWRRRGWCAGVHESVSGLARRGGRIVLPGGWGGVSSLGRKGRPFIFSLPSRVTKVPQTAIPAAPEISPSAA